MDLVSRGTCPYAHGMPQRSEKTPYQSRRIAGTAPQSCRASRRMGSYRPEDPQAKDTAKKSSPASVANPKATSSRPCSYRTGRSHPHLMLAAHTQRLHGENSCDHEMA